MVHLYVFGIMRLFPYEVSVIFNTLFPTLSKTLYTRVVKFPASTHHETVFQFVVICKMASTGPNRWQSQGARCASRMRKPVWGRALSWRRRTSLVFRLGRSVRMRCRSLFKVTLCRSWCAARSMQGISQRCKQDVNQSWQKCVENDWRLCEKIASQVKNTHESST
jgi:hypothetical protein